MVGHCKKPAMMVTWLWIPHCTAYPPVDYTVHMVLPIFFTRIVAEELLAALAEELLAALLSSDDDKLI